MINEQIAKHKKAIDEMSQIDMARLNRFAPAGHPYFQKYEPGGLPSYFEKSFKEKGGMAPGISKALGW